MLAKAVEQVSVEEEVVTHSVHQLLREQPHPQQIVTCHLKKLPLMIAQCTISFGTLVLNLVLEWELAEIRTYGVSFPHLAGLKETLEKTEWWEQAGNEKSEHSHSHTEWDEIQKTPGSQQEQVLREIGLFVVKIIRSEMTNNSQELDLP